MNFSIVRYIISWLLKFEALFLLLPCLVGFLHSEIRATLAYLATALLCLLSGILLQIKPTRKELYAREGIVSVALSWIIMSIFGAIPYMLSGDIPNYVDALFETVSGFTTTGATILSDVEALSYASLFWRSFTIWLGGMGVFVLILAIHPLMGGSTMNLMRAESPGPSVSKLLPKVKDTAIILYKLYIGFTVFGIVLLCICGLPFFDSITIAFGTIGTGGFGIKNTSMADYSALVQNVVTLLMILSGINFAFYFCLLHRQIKRAFSIEEVRFYLIIIVAATITITLNISHMYPTFGETIQHAFFQVGSIITTTGFSAVDVEVWPQFSKTILLVLMFIGSCAGSTGGGIKVSRLLILLKSFRKELSTMIHPRLVKQIKIDGRNLSQEVLRTTNVFIAMYFIVLLFSMLLISVDNLSFTTNFTAVVAALNNIGTGYELIGPTENFSVYSAFSKFILMFDMLAGRLELFPMLIILVPSCWKRY